MRQQKLPNCIGVIMDGNRRWAKEQGMSTLKGHQAGHQRFLSFTRDALQRGIQNLIFYAFSTENWQRSETEVEYLMKLFQTAFVDNLAEVQALGGRVLFIGDRTRFTDAMQQAMAQAEAETKNNTKGTVVIALSYGGRAEIVQAVNTLLQAGKNEITEDEFSQALWTKDIADPDLIIRTGEALRLSNFLPWQSVYSELYFTSTLWPDFDEEEFDYALEDYAERHRRHGK